MKDLVTHNSVHILRGLEELFPEVRFIERLRHCIEYYPECNWSDAMSRGQINSKQWILHQLQLLKRTHLGRVVVCGGWLGILSRLILDNDVIHVNRIESLDLSLDATIAAGELNSEYITQGSFLARVEDCYRIKYDDYDTIINTSCEHFEFWDDWWNSIPYGKLIVLQSNNFIEIDDHCNCVNSAEELLSMAEMESVLFMGSMPLFNYTRFMVIGIK